MKNQLSYQCSEYDCGPTTLLNAMRYLFEREEILPDIIRAISVYTLDAYDHQGEYGKSGTSRMAMEFISGWFNQFGLTKHFPIYTEMIRDDNVRIYQNSKIVECIQQQGVAIARVWLGGCEHYILITDVEENYLCIFDPYDWEKPLKKGEVIKIEGQPKKVNRKVLMDIFNEESERDYSFGKLEGREIMLLFNTKNRNTPEKTIEYFI
ncbi:MAG: peptidase C39 [Anaerocolumna sp.]